MESQKRDGFQTKRKTRLGVPGDRCCRSCWCARPAPQQRRGSVGEGYKFRVGLGVPPPRAPDGSLPVGVGPPQPMQRALPASLPGSLRRLHEGHQARLLQQLREEREPGLIGTENFPNEHEAE